MGISKFKFYVDKLNYGNRDISGDRGQNNGLTHAWLSSSIQISPEEQLVFVQKLADSSLAMCKKSQKLTKKIMYIQELPAGWKLYGKTGNGRTQNESGVKTLFQHGWFVGWIEKNHRKVAFVQHISDDEKQDVFASFRARNDALIELRYIIDELEK